MPIEMKDIKVGDKVHYRPYYSPKDKWEKGIVKAIGRSKDSVFVVYHCGEDWDNYQDYTAALTNLNDLDHGWDPEEYRLNQFLKKYSE